MRQTPVHRLRRRVLGFASIVVLAAGCDSTGPAAIAGTWVATTFQFTEVGEAPVDVLAEGGELTIEIAGDNTTSGTLTIPGSLFGGPDLTFDMEGLAVRNGTTVTFVQQEDTFVRDVDWQLSGNTLQGVRTDAGVTLTVTLTRQ
jgi:hypothetical protein